MIPKNVEMYVKTVNVELLAFIPKISDSRLLFPHVVEKYSSHTSNFLFKFRDIFRVS